MCQVLLTMQWVNSCLHTLTEVVNKSASDILSMYCTFFKVCITLAFPISHVDVQAYSTVFSLGLCQPLTRYHLFVSQLKAKLQQVC